MDFKTSETMKNLMRAFAGESMARNRYTFAASAAKKANLHVVEAVFTFTAGQEKEHGEIFYNHLRELAGETIHIDSGYPVDRQATVLELLRSAQHNEYEEHDDIYRHFAEVAESEGFAKIAHSFSSIAEIEKCHGNRFGQLADWLENGTLFVSEISCQWICLNCGYVLDGKSAPEKCPVCDHDKGYFIRVTFAPYTDVSTLS